MLVGGWVTGSCWALNMGSVRVCSRTWETNLKQSCFSDPEVQGIRVAKSHNKDIVECCLIGQKQMEMEITAGSQPMSGGVRHSPNHFIESQR